MPVVLLLCVLALATIEVWSQQPAQQGRALVIQGGTLIDVRQGTLTRDSVVVIEGERITAVGAAGQVTVPAGAQVINAGDKFVMPGLWDAHAHTRDFDAPLYINHGITSAMDMGNVMDWIMAVAEGRNKGLLYGPRIFPQGMSIAGKIGPHQWLVNSAEEARQAARTNIEAGVSYLKVYQEATPEMIKAVTEEAHKAGLNVTGHLRITDAREAILAGVDALAHGTGIAPATAISPEAAHRMKIRRELDPEFSQMGFGGSIGNHLQDPAKFDELIQLMLKHNVRLEPNIVCMFNGTYPESRKFLHESLELVMRDEVRVPPSFVRSWTEEATVTRPAEAVKRLEKGLANHQLFTRKFVAAGGKILVGDDAYIHITPGLAMWHEMELLAAAGVPPLAILQGATIHPAEFVHQDKELGTIEKGKLADILILGRNPLENISNIRSLESVIQHGKVQKLGYSPGMRNPIPRPFFPSGGSQRARPYLTSISPVAVPMGSGDFVLTIRGRDFSRQNRVLWEDTDLELVKFSTKEVQVKVPGQLLRNVGTYRVHMVTGGYEVEDEHEFRTESSYNYQNVLVTFGRKSEKRWNGQTRNDEF
jgi:imidazolonepropionase-like amidohydrolase